jgi:multiple sugar transport system permease protein
MALKEKHLQEQAAIAGATGIGGVTAAEAQPRMRVKRDHWGYIFITPWIVGFLLFQGGPLVASLYYSLTEYDVLSSPKFVGLRNYDYAFTGDPLFWQSLWRTSYFALLVVPLGLIGSILLAILLNQGLRGSSFFRTFFYIPSLTPAVAMAILWSWLLHPTLGLGNQLLKEMHLAPYAWLTQKDTVIPTLVMISLWAGVGGNTMLIFLAALQGVPRDLEEAAELDGASPFQKFRVITLPMISPVILFNLILSIIASFQVFSLAFVATDGGPSYGSWFMILHIYNQAFSYFRLGYGAALSWIFLAILMVITSAIFFSARRWVHYQGA